MLKLNKANEGLSLRREPVQDQLTGEAVSQLTLPLCGDSGLAAAPARLHIAELLGDGHLLVLDQNMKGAAAAASSVSIKASQECASVWGTCLCMACTLSLILGTLMYFCSGPRILF